MSDAGNPPPNPLVVIHEVLRRDSDATYETVEAIWRERYGASDLDRLRREFDEAVAQLRLERQRGAADRTVVLTVAIWIAAHVLLWLALGLPSYLNCRDAGCGIPLGLTAIVIGVAQLAYGMLVGGVVSVWNRPVAKGIFIGSGAAALLLTALCFGVANAR